MLPGLHTRLPWFSGGGWCCAWQRLRLWQLSARPSVGTAEHPSLPPTSQLANSAPETRMSHRHNMLQISGEGECVRREPGAAGLSLLSSGLSGRGGGKAAGASQTTCCSLSSCASPAGEAKRQRKRLKSIKFVCLKASRKSYLLTGPPLLSSAPSAFLKMHMVEVKMEMFKVCPGKGR